VPAKLKELHAAFLDESLVAVREIELKLPSLELKLGKSNPEVINEIFCATHSIKGASDMLGLTAVAALTRELEMLLDTIRSGAATLCDKHIIVLRVAMKYLNTLLFAARNSDARDDNRQVTNQQNVFKIIRALNQAIDAVEFDRLYETIDPDYRPDSNVSVVHSSNEGSLREQYRAFPISLLLAQYPPFVRKMSREVNKKIRLNYDSSDGNIDQRVLAGLGDCLLQLVRNAVDHGIETPDVRAKLGKDIVGTITIQARCTAENIKVVVSDDGRGLARAKLFQRACDIGLARTDERMSGRQIDELIFHPGLSTVSALSHYSGCGIGMAIVRRNINDLCGDLGVRSSTGSGCVFSIKLPRHPSSCRHNRRTTLPIAESR
jgi:chemotaxis protein histidine kinase CheA